MEMSVDLAMNNLSEILTEATEDEESVCYVTENDAETLQMAIDTMHKYQLMQADYENRLKVDMVAMLTEIQLEIEESENCGKAFHLGLQMASNIIQQKINDLKG